MDPYAARGNFCDFSRSNLIELFFYIIPLGTLSPTNRVLCMLTAIALHCLFFSPRMKRKERRRRRIRKFLFLWGRKRTCGGWDDVYHQLRAMIRLGIARERGPQSTSFNSSNRLLKEPRPVHIIDRRLFFALFLELWTERGAERAVT
jgi:hypothetical protein